MIEKVSMLADRRKKILIPIDGNNGYLIDEAVLRMYASPDQAINSLEGEDVGSFMRHLVRDYIHLYRKLEALGEL